MEPGTQASSELESDRSSPFSVVLDRRITDALLTRDYARVAGLRPAWLDEPAAERLAPVPRFRADHFFSDLTLVSGLCVADATRELRVGIGGAAFTHHFLLRISALLSNAQRGWLVGIVAGLRWLTLARSGLCPSGWLCRCRGRRRLRISCVRAAGLSLRRSCF